MSQRKDRSPDRWYGMPALLLVIALLPAFYPATSRATESSVEDRTIAMMLNRGLADSAIAYAKRRCLLHSDDPVLLARWTSRLMESYAGKALRTPDQSSTLWEQCLHLRDEFMVDQRDNARLPWVQWQHGRCLLLKAQSELAQYLAAPANSRPKESALSTIRALLSEMEKLEKTTRELQPLAPRSAVNDPSRVTASQLETLRADAALLRCEALLIRSELYPNGSRDRISAASDAETTAEELLTLTDKTWAAFQQLRIARASARLDLGKADIALPELIEIARNPNFGLASQRAAMAVIEYLCNAGKPSRARGFQPLVGSPSSEPSAALMELRIRLAEIQQTTNKSAKEAQLSAFIAAVRTVGETHGGYWRNRAEALLASSGAVDEPNTTTRDLIVVRVRQLLAADKKAEAIMQLIEARDNAAAQSNSADAILFAQQAAILKKLDGKFVAAADLLAETARQFPTQASASQAHLSSIRYRSDRLLQDPQNSDAIDQYEAALLEHPIIWPDAQSSQEVTQWAERWFVGRGQADKYTALLWQQLQKSQRSERASELSADWFASLISLSPESRAEAIAAARSSPATESVASDELQHVRLAALALYDWPEPEQARSIDSELNRLRAATNNPDSLWLNATRIARAIQQGQLSTTRRAPLNWTEQSVPDQLLLPLASCFLRTIDGTQQGSVPGWLAAIGLDGPAAQRLIGYTETKKQRARLTGGIVERLQATLAEDISSRRIAIESIKKLSREAPRNAWLQFHVARSLSTASQSVKTPGSEDLGQANAIYRRLMAGSKGSEIALWARWHWMRIMLQTGDSKQAADAANLFLASQPIESEVWLQRFQSISGRAGN
ncbi:MAG: hypothetical protein ACE361_04840 [Aureliella sp.]